MTPTPTTGPTPTPQPVCINGKEADDPGNNRESARLIRVNAPQIHGICGPDEKRSPDVDWFYFAGGAGKVYTIDVSEMSAGLDLVIELFDANGTFITGNDDFYQRNPNNASDLRPRIQSWRAPADGLYYFVVRDKHNSGGGDRTYTIALNGESFGPTPTQISELCIDLFEPDGLPENARNIFPNEIQPQHTLCPTGDADWVRFFGAAGKTYFFYTDTRPYSAPSVNRDTQSGADTVLFLFDRDGITRLGESDDIPDSLDSQISFVPPVDGFYFAQVKNRGDLGSQFIRYDLVMKLCVLGDTACGRAQPITVPTSSGTSANATFTATPDGGFALSPSATPTRSPTPSQSPTSSATTTPTFLSFSQVWQRADQPVAAQRATRTWMWGPKPLRRVSEGYADAPAGDRTVEYYDKTRMEITNPDADQSSQWYVTNGLLVVEMVRGQIQIGDKQFANRGSAAIPVAGDQDDPNAPTYASLAGVTSRAGSDRSGEYVATTLNRAGQVGDYSGPRRDETRLIHFVAQTGYNIPQVFWSFLNARGTVYEAGGYRSGTLIDWLAALGYPISDPYWTTVKVGGVPRQVLVQPFERRVLTYDPANPVGWQVEMGNVGRHYYLWRYGSELPQ